MKILSLVITCAAILTGMLPVKGENTQLSPYSRFGYGMLNHHANASQKSMGGVGIAQRSGQSINFMNPASYAAIDSVTFLFDIAADFTYLSTSENNGSDKFTGKNYTGGLDYFAMQFPLTRYGGMAIGMTPYSEVGYKFSGYIPGAVTTNEGSGTLNELFVGLAAKPFKGFTVGLNINYLFGTLLNQKYVYSTAATTLFERATEVRDWNIRLGVQYGAKINPDNELMVGLVFSPKKSFRGHTYGVKYDVGQTTPNDTVGYGSMKGRYDMAGMVGFGLAWKWRQKLTVEADYTLQQWKNCKFAPIAGFDQVTSDRFSNSWKAALGAEYVPALRGNYLQRIHYRLGGYASQDYIKVDGNSVKEQGVTLGFGLPAPSTKTMINFTVEYRHRASSPQKLVTENYLQFTLGVNINELWFFRNKIR